MQSCKGELISKLIRSSDCRLQLAYMKLESLVIADQLHSGEYVTGLVHTARHTMEIEYAQNYCFNHFLEENT